MSLWLYDDATGWGRKLLTAAHARNTPAQLFREVDEVDEGIAFIRMHLDPKTREHDKAVVAGLSEKGIRTIPTARAARLYDDKVAQARELHRWMPLTLIVEDPAHLADAIDMVGVPLMSKASEGASSHNVRFLQSKRSVRREAEMAFKDGVPLQYKQRQIGYVLLQQFCAGNAYDFRVIAVGRERLILRRGNRDDRPMASGANKEMPIIWPDAEATEVLAFANEFFEAEQFYFCGVDIVRDHEAGRWVILECTTSWPTKNNEAHATVSGRNWGEFFDIILDEIEAGAIG